MITSNVNGCYCNLSGSHMRELDGPVSLPDHVAVHTRLFLVLFYNIPSNVLTLLLYNDPTSIFHPHVPFFLEMKIYDLGAPLQTSYILFKLLIRKCVHNPSENTGKFRPYSLAQSIQKYKSVLCCLC